ncbi:hypothetical protein [Moraxella canis]|nr:hypothetical protein [Moraxella canis]
MLLINAGKLFPFTQKSRGGITRPEHINDIEKAVLDIKIIHADPNRCYYLRFVALDCDAIDNPKALNGWEFVSILKSDYEAGVDNITYLTQPSLDSAKLRVQLNGGIISHVFHAIDGQPELISVTLDGSFLPKKVII